VLSDGTVTRYKSKMPEGLSDQDRARIESAGQSASGCLTAAGYIGLGFAVLIALVGFVLMRTIAQSTSAKLVLAGIMIVCCLVGFGYFWISRR
jgi:hypothetical protein